MQIPNFHYKITIFLGETFISFMFLGYVWYRKLRCRTSRKIRGLLQHRAIARAAASPSTAPCAHASDTVETTMGEARGSKGPRKGWKNSPKNEIFQART